ncbi:MAG: VOC family protein [Methylobacter sp.]|uniref:VOC family protein n=1 Tax=Methylobacter sp. TaxID=2051955 RepID=UPI002587F577|nr:VOC family protein [Methylobacter sp.]MCL7422417.1 VOC family protein [Methylobacter sp.]
MTLSDHIQLKIHHVSIIVADTSKALGFYSGLLGLKTCERPNLPFPGAWLQLGEQQVHLLELPNPDSHENRPEHGGRDRHTAFLVNDLDAIQQLLEARDITYTLSKSGRRALFCRDPDGNAVELIQDLSVIS